VVIARRNGTWVIHPLWKRIGLIQIRNNQTQKRRKQNTSNSELHQLHQKDKGPEADRGNGAEIRFDTNEVVRENKEITGKQ